METSTKPREKILVKLVMSLDSRNFGKRIRGVCYPCGVTANVLTCLQRYGKRPDQVSFNISTYYTGECDCCGETTSITEARDFFYPDFTLIGRVAKFLSKSKAI